MQQKEHIEQVRLFEWAFFVRGEMPELELMFAIPNGGVRGGSKLQRIITGKKLKAEGVKAGVADIFLPVAVKPYHGLFLELKVKPNKPSEEQLQFLDNMNENGYLAVVCYSYEEAKDILTKYLNGKKDNSNLVESLLA